MRPIAARLLCVFAICDLGSEYECGEQDRVFVSLEPEEVVRVTGKEAVEFCGGKWVCAVDGSLWKCTRKCLI
jgi:hypothetical protein